MFSKKTLISILQGACLVLCSCIADRDKIPNKLFLKETIPVSDLKILETKLASSWPLDSLIKTLLRDNYVLSFDTALNLTATFISYKDTFQFKTNRIITIKAKQKTKIQDPDFYFGLAVQQIAFESSTDVESIKKRIETIIYDPKDSVNRKFCDRVRLHDKAIYYMVTPAKIFEKDVIRYDKKLEKILNAGL
jgi:hypothetical protein